MEIQRLLFPILLKAIAPNKVILLVGARRTGKTFLIEQLIAALGKEKCLKLNGEDVTVQQQLKERSISKYKSLVAGFKYIFIDEAQKIPDIGLILKLMVDEIKGIRLIVTGSSMFDLKNKLGEPLTGRKKDFMLFPLSQMEYNQIENKIEMHRHLDDKLIFGGYPELLQLKTAKQKQEYLHELVSSYLYKDILVMENLRSADKIIELLKLIAWQIGGEVSLEELGRNLQMSKNTVERYLDLLTKVFVLFKISGYSRNLHNEIVKTKRWYFYDNGIRNAVIMNFQSLQLRNDSGMLWENYLASERLRFQHNINVKTNNYFWRTHDRQEIDWVEERAGKLAGFEFKFTDGGKKTKPPIAWKQGYPDASFKVIHKNNFEEFILIKRSK
ncbi:MAG: ATP-binding protein [Chitinophagales bacterium]|nr:ATP-binding protein [Chitinophagales bacterium]